MIDFSKVAPGPSKPDASIVYSYGTVGYRGNATDPPNGLDYVAYRCGLLATCIPLLACSSHGLRFEEHLTIGVVITASHNPKIYNGVKLFDKEGGIITGEWEIHLDEFVNTNEQLDKVLAQIFKKCKLEEIPNVKTANVLVGYDTRDSSFALGEIVKYGVGVAFDLLNIQNGKCTILGYVTTPTVPYLLAANLVNETDDSAYIDYLITSAQLCAKAMGIDARDKPKTAVFYDCSYGVGGLKLDKLNQTLELLGVKARILHVPNLQKRGKDNLLNVKCGSDYVLTSGNVPVYLNDNYSLYEGERICSFDGDADRLIYYSAGPNGKYVKLVDGIKAMTVQLLLLEKLFKKIETSSSIELQIGVVVTRYANGAATKFLSELLSRCSNTIKGTKWTLQYSNTGVKCTHAHASKYDLAVYYEANGHGNLLYKPSVVNEWLPNGENERVKRLKSLLNMYQSPGGDSDVNLLAFEIALNQLDLDLDKVDALYTELPCLNATVKVPLDKMRAFKTHPDDESTLEHPRGIKDGLEEITRQYEQVRAFIRPSGTEPVCRIYVEAPSHQLAASVQERLSALVEQYITTCSSAV